ncbi:hypothetical protein D9M71_493720 [compost metagenome]
MALLRKLRSTRASSWVSLLTSAELGTKSRVSPSLAAIWWYSAARLSSRSAMAKAPTSGLITPASSLETSTRVPSRLSTSSSELLTLRISPALGAGTGCSSRALVNSRAALSGCSRSWLTAARNLVFDRLACSASRLASRRRASARARSSISSRSWLFTAVSSAVRSRTRRSRFW